MQIKKAVPLFSCIFLLLVFWGIPNSVHADDPYQRHDDPLFQKTRDKFENKLKEWEKQLENGTDKRDIRKEFREALDELEKDTKFFTGDAKAHLLSTMVMGALKFYPRDSWFELYKRYRVGPNAPCKDSKYHMWEYLDKVYKDWNELLKKNEKKVSCRPGLNKLENVLTQGQYTLKVIGNGAATSQCLLAVENSKNGAVLTTPIKTVCASTLHDLPPLPFDMADSENLNYKIGKADPKNIAIVKAANKLSEQGKFGDLGLTDSVSQVRQLAIWQHQGKKSGNPENFVTSESVKKKIVGNVQLTPEENQALDGKVKNLLASVDLTLKTAEETETPEENDKPPFDSAVLPKDEDNKKPNPDTNPPDSNEGGDGTDSFVSFLTEPAYVPVGPFDGYIETCLPPFTRFTPNKPKHQSMETIEEQIALVPVSQDPPEKDSPPPKEVTDPDGSKTTTYFHPDGKPSYEVRTYPDGQKQFVTVFYPNGQKKTVYSFPRYYGTGPVTTTEYYESGNIKSETTVTRMSSAMGESEKESTRTVTYPDTPPTKGNITTPPKLPTPTGETTTVTTSNETRVRIKDGDEVVSGTKIETTSTEKNFLFTPTGEKYVSQEKTNLEVVIVPDSGNRYTDSKSSETKTYSGPKDSNPKTESSKLKRNPTTGKLEGTKKF